jgi:release factor glutamine methyltransferase
VTALCSNLLSATAPGPQFDVILSSPPSFSGEPLCLADRAWHSGPANRDIADLFDQARERLRPAGRMFVLLSSDSDLSHIAALMARANFRACRVAERSILVESFILYELQARGKASDGMPAGKASDGMAAGSEVPTDCGTMSSLSRHLSGAAD